jgi:hypothetical protein
MAATRPAHHALVIVVILVFVGCVPTMSTIGGHSEAELQQWADQARHLCLERTKHAPRYPFTTDGCTLWPDCTWQMCCVDHDMQYWCGGSAAERLRADQQLRSCIAEHGGGVGLARLAYWGVRAGGHPLLPVYWRWGYGWPWPRVYSGAQDN